jgi:hypothetical protein
VLSTREKQRIARDCVGMNLSIRLKLAGMQPKTEHQIV